MKFTDLLKNKIFIFLGGCLLIFMLVIVFRQFAQRNSVQKEIDDLKNQAAQYEQSNQQLQSFISYLKTDDYMQKAARQQLNLKKDGESVYSFSDTHTQTQPAAANDGTEQRSANISGSMANNLRQWWNYFFRQSS